MVPGLGHGDVLDAVHHLMHFALDLLTPRRIEEHVDAEYITSMEWYDTLPEILAGELGDDGATATGEDDFEFLPHDTLRGDVHKSIEDALFVAIRLCHVGVLLPTYNRADCLQLLSKQN